MSPPPLPTKYNVERSKELSLYDFNTVRGVGGGGKDVVSVARGYNFACVKKRLNCTTVPRLLPIIVELSLLLSRSNPIGNAC